MATIMLLQTMKLYYALLFSCYSTFAKDANFFFCSSCEAGSSVFITSETAKEK